MAALAPASGGAAVPRPRPLAAAERGAAHRAHGAYEQRHDVRGLSMRRGLRAPHHFEVLPLISDAAIGKAYSRVGFGENGAWMAWTNKERRDEWAH